MKPEMIVVPLGPGSPDMLTLRAAQLLQDGAYRLVLRTSRHPVSGWLSSKNIKFESLDSLYDEYEDFDQLHLAMADWLWKEAASGPICFGVMDPLNDGAVSAVRKAAPRNGHLEILPGTGTMNMLLSRLPRGFSTDSGIQFFSASGFISDNHMNPDVPLLITELDSSLLAGEVKLKLLELFPDDQKIVFFCPAGEDMPSARSIPLYQMDAQKKYDHTAAVFIPGTDYLRRNRYTFHDLEQIVRKLRAPDGCPWDRVQTHDSLKPYLVEEAWEVTGSIDEQDMLHLADELGDVLFQVFFHASIAEAYDEFSLTDILSAICRKMIKRHPHVFGKNKNEHDKAEAEPWEKTKWRETGVKTVGESLNQISPALPSLKYAAKIYRKLAEVPGCSRAAEVIFSDIQKNLNALYDVGSITEKKMGLLLLKCVELCYAVGWDAELLLHRQSEALIAEYQESESSSGCK